MEWVAVAATAVIAGVVGVAVGFFVRGVWASQTVKAAQDKAGRIVAEARAQQKDMILEAKDEKLRLQREAEEEARAKRSELQGLERRLLVAVPMGRSAAFDFAGQRVGPVEHLVANAL